MNDRIRAQKDADMGAMKVRRTVEQDEIERQLMLNRHGACGVFPKIAGAEIGNAAPEMAQQLEGIMLAVGAALHPRDARRTGITGVIIGNVKKFLRDR